MEENTTNGDSIQNDTSVNEEEIHETIVQPSFDFDDENIKEFYKLILPECSISDIGKAMEHASETLGGQEFDKQVQMIGTYVELLKRMLDAHTEQTVFIAESLSKIKDPKMVGDSFEHKADPNVEGDKNVSLRNKVIKFDQSRNGAEVSGYEARMLILASNRNVKRIWLYNSGFSLVLRGPSLGEINLIYNKISDQMGEYGKMLGAIFYIYSDFKIKEILWEFIESLVLESNLNKWDRGNRLRDNTSLLDYMPILLHVGTLMFKDGYDLVHVCPNPTCQHQNSEIVDLNMFQLSDFSRIPYEQLEWLATGVKVEPDKIRKYKASLGLSISFDIDKYRIYRNVPSMTDYINNGNLFNNEMATSIHDITDPKIIDQYLKYNYSLLFSPWISHIEVLDSNGNPSFKVIDRENITLALTELQNSGERENFTKQMNSYIQEASITNTGYIAKPCEACNTLPSNAVNGFIPFDAQTAFFSMLVMRLIQNS